MQSIEATDEGAVGCLSASHRFANMKRPKRRSLINGSLRRRSGDTAPGVGAALESFCDPNQDPTDRHVKRSSWAWGKSGYETLQLTPDVAVRQECLDVSGAPQLRSNPNHRADAPASLLSVLPDQASLPSSDLSCGCFPSSADEEEYEGTLRQMEAPIAAAEISTAEPNGAGKKCVSKVALGNRTSSGGLSRHLEVGRTQISAAWEPVDVLCAEGDLNGEQRLLVDDRTQGVEDNAFDGKSNFGITACRHHAYTPSERHALRRYLYKEAIQFAWGSPGFRIFLSARCPTDPMALVTEPPKVSMRKRHNEAIKSDPSRARWGGMGALFFVLVCEGIRSGIVLAAAAESTDDSRALFYAACLIFWCVAAIPLLQLQHALSQFLQGGPVRTFCLLHPRLRGIGVAMLSIILFRAPFQIRALGESLLYVVESLKNRLNWTIPESIKIDCASLWGKTSIPVMATRHCVDMYNNGSWVPYPLSPAVGHYQRTVIGPLEDSTLTVNSYLAVSCLVGVCLVLLGAVWGIRFFGQIAAFTICALFLFFVFLTVCSLHFRGAKEGLLLFFSLGQDQFRSLASFRLWSSAALLVVRSSVVLAGHNCIMLSYTKVGKNVLHMAWIVGFFSILVSFWCVAIIYSLLGSLFVINIRNSVITIFSHLDPQLPDSTVHHLVIEEVTKKISSPDFPSYLKVALQSDAVQEFFFVLYPWAIRAIPGGQMLGIIFYFCISITGAVAVAGTCLVILCSFREIKWFERTNQCVGALFVAGVVYLLAVPSFFNSPRLGTDSEGYIGRRVAVKYALSTFQIGVPIVGLCTIFGVSVLFGFAKQAEILPRGLGIAYNVLMVVVIFLAFVFGGRVYFPYHFMVAAVIAVAILVLCPLLLVAWLSPGHMKKSLWMLLVGDAEVIRKIINGIWIDRASHQFRLRKAWSFKLKLGCIIWFCLLLVSWGGFPHNAHLPRWGLPNHLDHVHLSDAMVFVATTLPILLFVLAPNMGRWLDPSETYRWKVSDVKRRHRESKRYFRRLPLRLGEEYLAPEAVWASVDTEVLRRM